VTTASTPASPSAPLRARPRWRVVDIVTAGVLGVASGIVFWAWGLAYSPLTAPLAFLPGLSGLVGGGFYFAAVLGALVIRKPGAALFVELVAGFVSMIPGTQWGFTVMISALVQGLGAELVFAAFRYRRFGLGAAVLAGMGAALGAVAYEYVIGNVALDAAYNLTYLGTNLVSGALLAGVVSVLLVRALAATGALARFPAGREAARTTGSRRPAPRG
jgi:energy-coupling factor transport system permease protein